MWPQSPRYTTGSTRLVPGTEHRASCIVPRVLGWVALLCVALRCVVFRRFPPASLLRDREVKWILPKGATFPAHQIVVIQFEADTLLPFRSVVFHTVVL